MKKLMVLVALAVLLFSACSTTYVRLPEAAAVKKVAVLSVYLNGNWADVEAEKGLWSKSNNVAPFKQALARQARPEFEAAIASLGWEVLPYQEMTNHPAYLALQKRIEQAYADQSGVSEYWIDYGSYIPSDYFTQREDRLDFIPGDALNTEASSISTDGPQVSSRQTWGKLAKDLGVDAVVVVGVTVAINGVAFGTATARTDYEIVAIDTAGAAVINTNGGFSLSLGNIAESRIVTMTDAFLNYVLDADGEAAIKETFTKTAQVMGERLKKELAGE